MNTPPNPTAARYLLDSRHPPPVECALPLGEMIHRALVLLSDCHPTFTGYMADGQRAHCQIIPEARPSEVVFSRLLLYAPQGFDTKAQAALHSLERATWGSRPLRLHLLGMGEPQDFAGPKHCDTRSLAAGRSAVWSSFTPFVPTRYPKTTRAGAPKLDAHGHQRGGATHDLLRLLEARGWPPPCDVRELGEGVWAGRRFPWAAFSSWRSHGNGQRGGYPTGFRVTFPCEVQGPLTLGYGAHFGLGIFLPCPAEDAPRPTPDPLQEAAP